MVEGEAVEKAVGRAVVPGLEEGLGLGCQDG